MMAGWLNRRSRNRGGRTGSALILTVVLTSLLAIVGVLFVMAARLDKIGSTAASESQTLDFAVETVVAQISEALEEDVPGVSPGQEYYDYPDANNLWLAELEPYKTATGEYAWRQVSNLTGTYAAETEDVPAEVMGEHDAIPDVNSLGSSADADGDGIADARWYVVPGVASGKGKPIYAAVRVVDSGGMLNVNTGYWFDPEWTDKPRVDGSSLRQINVAPLAGGVSSESEGAVALLGARAITDMVNGLTDYERKVTWGYLRQDPCDPNQYTPFDLVDELALRYRFILGRDGVDTLAEEWGRFKDNRTLSVPVDTDVPKWFGRAADGLDPNYAYRHVATTYNMDRVITPQPIQVASRQWFPWKMVNVNTRPPDDAAIREAIALALGENNPDPVAVAAQAAQITANLLDYMDEDDEVTALPGPDSPTGYYFGFERPCVYISEIACHFVPDTDDPDIIHKSYAIELYKPYFEDNDPGNWQWRLVVTSPSGAKQEDPIRNWSGLRRFQVMLNQDSKAQLFDNGDFSDPAAGVDTTPYDRTLYTDPLYEIMQSTFDEGDTISLERWVMLPPPAEPNWVPVDSVEVPTGWMDPNSGPRSFQRDISPHRCIRRIWSTAAGTPALGRAPDPNVPFGQSDGIIIQAHPANRLLTNIGDLGRVFARSAYDDAVVKNALPEQVLFDLMNPNYARVFNYLTVMDPTDHMWDPNETRVMGRINVNTAPWFVLGQLPWMQYADGVAFEKARAVVDYRNVNGPFKSPANLTLVPALRVLASDRDQNWHWHSDPNIPKGPDLDPMADTALDDFEERDLLVARMSDLATVRSDVYTAYMLVRIGVDGPQKRAMAILDRSDVTPDGGHTRVIAVHSVPDPR